jgi:hypothetical protein
MTEEAAEACRVYLDRVQRAWRRQLNRLRDPAAVFRLAPELAELEGTGRAQGRKDAEERLHQFASRAVREENWKLLEKCVETYLSESVSIQDPKDFQENYLRLLTYLGKRGESSRLARHLLLFAAALPEATYLIEPLLVAQLKRQDEEKWSFYAILKRIGPHSREVGEFERENHGVEFDVQGHLAGLVDSSRFPCVREWLQKEDVGELTHLADGLRPPGDDASQIAPATSDGAHASWFGRHSSGKDGENGVISETMLTGFLGTCVFGSIVLPILLLFMTLRRGFFRFRWYGLVALWIGFTVGAFVAS